MCCIAHGKSKKANECVFSKFQNKAYSELSLSYLVINLERNHHTCFFLSSNENCLTVFHRYAFWFDIALLGGFPLFLCLIGFFKRRGRCHWCHSYANSIECACMNTHTGHTYTIIWHQLIQGRQCIHLYLEHQGGCVCVCIGWNSTQCQSVTAWIRFPSVCSVAIQNYGRNLRPRLTELNRLAAPERQRETNRYTHTAPHKLHWLLFIL